MDASDGRSFSFCIKVSLERSRNFNQIWVRLQKFHFELKLFAFQTREIYELSDSSSALIYAKIG